MKMHAELNDNPVDARMLEEVTIQVREPLSQFLKGTGSESHFSLSLLDAARFAGHACPAMVGAFLTARAAVNALFPDDHVCVRGLIEIDLPGGQQEGATGPVSNLLGFVTGAWAESGFGGLDGRFRRRGLLRYGVRGVPHDVVRFRRADTGVKADVRYRLQELMTAAPAHPEFQIRWRNAILLLLRNPERFIEIPRRP